MPTYRFRDPKTGHEWSEIMTIAEMEAKEKAGFEVLPAAPLIGDPVRQGVKKPDGSFRERLQEIQHNHPRGSSNPW